MAEEVVDLGARLAGLPRRACETALLPLHGAMENADSVYGAEQAEVNASGASDLLHPRLPYTIAEVRWAVREEMAQALSDVLARRTRALFLDARATVECAPAVARIMAEELFRSAKWIESECASFRDLAAGYCGVM
jgi:glycerol-3-phosphate dehydrogenase